MCDICDVYSAFVSGNASPEILQSEAAQLLQPSLEMMLDQSGVSTEPPQSDRAVIEQALPLALQELQNQLADFVDSDASYLGKMRLAFGENFDADAALELANAWQTEDFSILPEIDFLSAAELGGATAAYEAETATIYLSIDFVSDYLRVYEDDISVLAALIAEELGHHIDTVLNGSVDSQGDEGAIFSALLAGKSLSDAQLQRLQQDDDSATVALSEEQGGGTLQVEQNQTSISFVEVTDTAGEFVSGRSYGAGAWGDFNGDGLPDLWVNNHFGTLNAEGDFSTFGRNLFVNNGDGTFTDVVNNGSGVFINSELQGDYHGAAWADFDNDGDQDLIQVVGGEGNTAQLGEENTGEDSEPNRLYINDNGVLRDQAVEYGLSYNSAKAQAAIWLDYDNDGRLDLFHGSTDRADGLNPTTLFRQKADETFEDVGEDFLSDQFREKPVKFGGIGDLSNDSPYNLAFPGGQVTGILDIATSPFTDITEDIVNRQRLKGAQDFAFADFNNDLLIDVYLPRFGQGDRYFLNSAEGLIGTDATPNDPDFDELEGTRFGAGVVAADFDNDMDVDIFVLRGAQEARGVPNILYDNQGDGTFITIANAGGILPADRGIRDNVTTADYDVDGFVDLFITNGTATATNGPQQLFRNQGNSNNWLQIDLQGVQTNRDGIGAKVYVTTADGKTQRRDQNGGVHERSQNHQRLHFGLAQNTEIESIRIEWPSGIVQEIANASDVQVNDVIVINESAGIVDDNIPIGGGNNGGGNNGGGNNGGGNGGGNNGGGNNGGGNNGGGNNGGGNNGGGNNGTSSPFTSGAEGRLLELTTLGENGLTFGFDSVNVGRARQVTVRRVNGGSSPVQIGSFSLLQAGEPSGFAPSFSIRPSDVDEGDTLEFEIEASGGARKAIATPTEAGADLDFGNGTKLSLSAGADDGDDYITGDADSLNFGSTGGADIRFTVYREASFDSVVGLYKVDNLNGDITVGNQTFSVGDAGYSQAALDSAVENANLQTSDGSRNTFTVSGLDGLYGTFITVQNSELDQEISYFSYSALNSGNNDHVRSIGNNAIGFEDMPGLGDADFDDVVITFAPTA
ncbi:MAG: FG-GAP-like repeat-containing protein [Cyanobacteria bacterium P01_D01_bin.1]